MSARSGFSALAQSRLHAIVGVVGVERGEIHQRDGAQQPGGLVVALDRTPLGHRRHPPLERRCG
jgi:hypothetical protein